MDGVVGCHELSIKKTGEGLELWISMFMNHLLKLCAALLGRVRNAADGRPQLWPSSHHRGLNREQDSKAFLVLACLSFCCHCYCYLLFVFILVCFGQRNIPVTCILCFSSGSVLESWGSPKSQSFRSVLLSGSISIFSYILNGISRSPQEL